MESKKFFEAVAAHNLERFHSETIAWIFNTFRNTAKNFILKVHTEIENISEIKFENDNEFCWAEKNQIDILLKYSYKEKNYKIIIENKIKASEHQIKIDKLKINFKDERLKKIFTYKELAFLTTKNNNEDDKNLSQTEFYYLREKLNRSEDIVNFELEKHDVKNEDFYNALNKYVNIDLHTAEKISSKKKKVEFINALDKNFNHDYCRYVFLKPSRIKKEAEKYEKQLTDWNLNDTVFSEKLNSWSNDSLDNPWISLTYEDLVNEVFKDDAINETNTENEIIAKGYIEYVKDNIKEKIDLDNFNNNTFGKFDYFKLLMELVKSKFYLNEKIYEYIEAGSSNGSLPLFAFYKEIKIDENFIYFKEKSEYINIGIQVQGNNLKYYVSADNKDYDNTTIKAEHNKKEKSISSNYGKFVESLLYEITKSDGNFLNDTKGFHPNTTKTFYSRSYKIDGFVKDDKDVEFNPRTIFEIAEEISLKVNSFIERTTNLEERVRLLCRKL